MAILVREERRRAEKLVARESAVRHIFLCKLSITIFTMNKPNNEHANFGKKKKKK